MKRKEIFLTIIFSLLITCSGRANLESIIVLSEEYHVWGEYSVVEEWGKYPEDLKSEDSYDLTSSSHISGEVSWSSTSPGWEGISAWGFAGNGLGGVYPSEDQIYAEASVSSDIYYSWGDCYAESTAVLTFRPAIAGTLTGIFRGGSEYGFAAGATLLDITAGVTMFSEGWPNWAEELREWTVDPSHEYELSLYADGHSDSDQGGVDSWVTAELSVIPEPATIFLLGVGGLVLLRKRTKR